MKHNIESIEGRVKAVTPQYLLKLIFLQKSFSCKKMCSVNEFRSYFFLDRG